MGRQAAAQVSRLLRRLALISDGHHPAPECIATSSLNLSRWGASHLHMQYTNILTQQVQGY